MLAFHYIENLQRNIRYTEMHDFLFILDISHFQEFMYCMSVKQSQIYKPRDTDNYIKARI